MNKHNYTSTVTDTVVAALHAGVDLHCGMFFNANAQTALNNQTIVQALIRTFTILLRLGYFHPPEQQIY
jgi:hypothetical protein